MAPVGRDRGTAGQGRQGPPGGHQRADVSNLRQVFAERAGGGRVRLDIYSGRRRAVYRASKSLGLQSGDMHKSRRFSARPFFSQGYDLGRRQGMTSADASAERLGHARPDIRSIYLRA